MSSRLSDPPLYFNREVMTDWKVSAPQSRRRVPESGESPAELSSGSERTSARWDSSRRLLFALLDNVGLAALPRPLHNSQRRSSIIPSHVVCTMRCSTFFCPFFNIQFFFTFRLVLIYLFFIWLWINQFYFESSVLCSFVCSKKDFCFVNKLVFRPWKKTFLNKKMYIFCHFLWLSIDESWKVKIEQL